MSEKLNKKHPRYDSLSARYSLEDAQKNGLLAGTAMIAHGRGEAFDYLIGEQSISSALNATRYAAKLLSSANKPIISVNGNTAVLCGDYLIRCAAIIGCAIEINIFYRTNERITQLTNLLKNKKKVIAKENINIENWAKKVEGVKILGENAKCKILNLEGPRSNCCCEGIYDSDVIFVPLEDGDRCEALVQMGKCVIVVDLNPLSRSAQMANVTIVDDIARVGKNLFESLLSQNDLQDIGPWDNIENINESLRWINERLIQLANEK